MLRGWWAGPGSERLARKGATAAELMAETATNVAVSRANADRLVDWFCETIVTSEFHAVVDIA